MSDGGDDERLLQRFGEWLSQARAEAGQLDRNGSPTMAEYPGIDEPSGDAEVGLYRLVEEFTALRHEVKLQTRSSRGLEDEIETLLGALRQSIEALRSIEPKEAQAAWAAGKALATALAELDDALDRGRQQTEKAVVLLAAGPEVEAAELVRDFYERQSRLARWRHAGFYRRLLDSMSETEQPPRRAALLDALVDGYRLIQKRLAQSLAAEGILRIDAVGRPVDPERMVVVEVVEADDLPVGVVYDELRRGYTWNGRVLRYAEVRATRNGS